MAKKETKKKEKMAKKAENKVPPSSGKKSKKNKADAATGLPPNVDPSQLTAEQLTQVLIEEAIKESQDPSSKLKKLRSPLSVKGCLLNILILVVLTVGIVFLCCYLLLDHETFNLWVVIKDMLRKIPTEKHSVMWLFQKIAEKFKAIFHI